jgi:3-phosphoshikimate 1-carboxyvinyltransferase
VTIHPAKRIRGRVTVPGDKSISHRAAILSALAQGTSTVTNFSSSQDCGSTLSCLRELGLEINRIGHDVTITGGKLTPASQALDCGNSGSTMRMLAGVLASRNFESTLTGDASLQARPMKRIIEPLTAMGASIASDGGRPPLNIRGASPLTAIRYELPVASAQVKSCVLLAGLAANGPTEVIEHTGTRDHTERMMRWFGIPLKSGSAGAIAIDGPIFYRGTDVSVPGDISSAAFLIAAAALLPDSDLLIQNVGINPTRTAFLRVLQSFGCAIEVMNAREICNEPVAEIRVLGSNLRATSAIQVRGELIPSLIDELPLLAVVGSQIEGGIEIRDAAELRLKETDRIAATVANLRAMEADVEEFEDGLAVRGPALLKGARLQAFGDHRIAMAFTIAALLADSDSTIDDPGCVDVSFPGFFLTIKSIAEDK